MSLTKLVRYNSSRKAASGRLDFFISYKTVDKQLAGRVAQYLHGNGHDFFLAHDDLEITPDFERDIKNRIDNCTALLAIVTPNFEGAAYPNQEVGYAMKADKPIIPLWFPGVQSDKLGFLSRVNAIHATEGNLFQSVSKAVDWAEASLRENFVRPADGGPVQETIDRFLELRQEPYYRVLVRPQGMYILFEANAENDTWLKANKPRLFDLLDARTTESGIEFTYPGSYRAEVNWTGTVCFGQAVPRIDGVMLEAFVGIIAQIVEYSKRIFGKYGWNAQQHGLLIVEFKIGHSHGQTLKTGNPSEINGRDTTNLEAVKAEIAVPFETPTEAILEKILLKVCRGFGFGMLESNAKSWVKLSLNQNPYLGLGGG